MNVPPRNLSSKSQQDAPHSEVVLSCRVRLGVHTGRITGIKIEAVNELFLQVQPTHLKVHAGTDLAPEELREARANLVRKQLG